jgi:hypothetical protein
MWVSEKQKLTLVQIKKINELQRTVWIDEGIKIVEEAIKRIKARDGDIEKQLKFEIMKVAYDSNLVIFRRMFTKGELPSVTLHTLTALEDKGILEKDEPFGEKGATYWLWTGNELEGHD